MDEDVNNFLINREEIATTQIINDVPISSLNNYEQIIIKTNLNEDLDNLKFKDTTLYDIIGDQFHDYRKLEVKRKIGEEYFHITIFKSLIQSNILVNEVLKTMITVFLGLLIFLILGNVLISKGLWGPFKKTLLILKKYELGSTKSINFNKTSTREFNQLNQMLNVMIKKIHYDYINLKEFTENAAHEIQTPLAIIRNKCELLIQSQGLTSEQLNQIRTIYNSCLRLSKINRGLTLLAKIESGDYEAEKRVNITEILKAQLDHYKEIFELNKLTVKSNISHTIYHDINPELAEILISNLFRNAIKHNIKEGIISVKTMQNSINFSNTGIQKKIDNEQFHRFKKSNQNSLGLGLSIIAKICKRYNMKFEYIYKNEKHNFNIIFKTDSLQI